MKRIAWALLLWLPALPAAAQDRRPLTDDAAAAVAAFHNGPGTTRLSGETRIAAGTTLDGDVATVGGPLRLGGTIRGDVVVINGDLRLLPGGRITGDLTVVGGEVAGDLAGVAGAVVVYTDALRFRREGDRLVALGRVRPSWLSAGRSTPFGRVQLGADVDGAYNRVEGLPVSFGPRIELEGTNPTVLDARLIYRTRSGLRIHPDELGHDLRLEQYVGGHRAVRVGLGMHRVVDPIEDNGVSDTENSLSTFILHRDYRDHYARRGWSAYIHYDARTRPLELRLEYRDETHGSVPTRTPWSLLDNDEPWRAQPQVAEGDLRTLAGLVRWDSRNDPEDPASGWLVEIRSEQGLEGGLRLERDPLTGPETGVLQPVSEEFTALALDVRRYLRVGPRTRLAVRAAAAGSPDDGALPPQRQHVLGGEGSLPAFNRFAFDCGARAAAPEDGLLPYYGCDRAVLFQAEYRYALDFGDAGFGRRLGLDFDLVTRPELIVFADAGRAWIEEESLNGRADLGTGFRYDAGVGLRLGRIGLYLAVPFSDDGELNFFVRLDPRL